jgi:hypothetical protein
MKLKTIPFLVIIMLCYNYSQAQNNNNQFASKQAKKMNHNLHLQDSLSIKLYNINLSIINSKMYARKRISNRDSLTIVIQSIENNRDNLYKSVLSKEQFLQYRKQKNEILKMD